MFNRNSIPFACLVAMALPMAANADDYRAEVDLTFDRALLDGDNQPDPDVWGIGATYFFEPVKTDGVPLAEAAFLNRSSFVGAGARHFDLGYDEVEVFDASIGYYLPNTIFYGQLNYTYVDDFGGEDSFGGELGVAPIDGLLVTTAFDEDGWDPNVRAKYVGKFRNAQFFAATLDIYEEYDDDYDFALGFDYYFDPTFSIGVSHSEYSKQLRAEKFFSPRFAVSAHFDIGDDDLGDGLGARLSWRF